MIGETLDKYKIIANLGEGGVAKVFLVEDIADNKLYALKMLKQDYVSNQNIRKRFIDEAKKLARINHVNVVKVFKTIDQGDIVAFSMELISGKTLKNNSNLDDDGIKDIMYQILEGLKAVHKIGIVHRDLTPTNIMITDQGLVKILDFGISKDLNSTVHDGTIIGTTFTMGTPRYMSPEQYNDTSSTTIKSDIYSLGVILWEMVKGEMVYSNINTIHALGDKILKEKLPLTKTCWDKLIQKATHKNPKERFQNTDEFIQAIKTHKCGVIFPWKKIAVIIGALFIGIVIVLGFNYLSSNEKENKSTTKADKKIEKSDSEDEKTVQENEVKIETDNEPIIEVSNDEPSSTQNADRQEKPVEIQKEIPKIKIIPTKLTRVPGENRITWNPELTNNAESITISFITIDGKIWVNNEEVFGSSYDYSPGNSDAGGKFTKVILNVTLKDGQKLSGSTVLSKQIFKCN